VGLTGWLLDAYISGDQAILWFKTKDGKTLRLFDSYHPDFYVKLKDRMPPEEMLATIREHPHILDASIELKYPSVMERKEAKVVHVVVDRAQGFREVLSDLEGLGCIDGWFNVDILHIQRYAFSRGLAPTQKIYVDWGPDGSLRKANALASKEDASKEDLDLNLDLDLDLEIRPPPFTTLIFRVDTEGGRLRPESYKDPIAAIVLLGEDLSEEVFEGSEERILEAFAEAVRERDPDFLVAYDFEEAIPYLIERIRRKGLGLQLGREPADPTKTQKPYTQAFPGRVALSLDDYCHYGMAGIVERSLFSMVPPGLASRWAAGRLIDSRQCFEALRRGILIPRLRSPAAYGTTAMDLALKDRGGLILSPVVGLHENVASLDFESMFPNILVRYNISYETVTPQGIECSRRGFLGEMTKGFLERRLYFKRLRKGFPQGSQEWLWCEQRQSALKEILVCIYGFSGCDMNRFGNVYTYAKVNEVSREILIRAMGICRSRGYRILYADCDSVFVQKEGASREDYEGLAKLIGKEVGLPIALDHHFKFLVLLAREADPSIEAVRRYFGKLMDGELFYRGIELRRRDCPPFIKEFEERLMGILFDAERKEDVMERQYARAKDYVVRTLEELGSGIVPTEELAIRKMLRKPLDSYRFLLPHVSAAIQMAQRVKRVKRSQEELQKRSRIQVRRREGQPIDFLYVNAGHPNPLRRVMPADMVNDGHNYYDREKYKEILLDVAETVLGWNGFRRESLGFRARP
jgi:DNA polymerase elongation subunit (family B)